MNRGTPRPRRALACAALGALVATGCQGAPPGGPHRARTSRPRRFALHGDMAQREVALRKWLTSPAGRFLHQEELWAGHVARPDDPAIAAVGALLAVARDGSVSVHCTATLIAPDIVITAAHCFASRPCGNANPGDRFEFVQGLHADDAPAGDLVVAMTCASADPCHDDLALARLATRIAYDATGDLGIAEPDSGAPLVKIGYGAYHPAGGDLGDWVPAGTRAEANAQIDPPPLPDQTTFTYRGHNADDSDVEICGGDSGGPGIQTDGARYRLVGITRESVGTSSAPAAADCNPLGTDTRLAAFAGWVASARVALPGLAENRCR